MMGRTRGVSFWQASLTASCMRRARKPGTGVKPFFSETPRMTVPPWVLEKAESVSTKVVGSFFAASLTSQSWVSLPIWRMRSMISWISSASMISV